MTCRLNLDTIIQKQLRNRGIYISDHEFEVLREKNMETSNSKTQILILTLILFLISTVGCTTSQQQSRIPNLNFEVSIKQNLDRDFLISLGVWNTGSGMFEGDDNFNGVMEVWDEGGNICTRAEIFRFDALEHGESVFPITWRGKLLPGEYKLTWLPPTAWS